MRNQKQVLIIASSDWLRVCIWLLSICKKGIKVGAIVTGIIWLPGPVMRVGLIVPELSATDHGLQFYYYLYGLAFVYISSLNTHPHACSHKNSTHTETHAHTFWGFFLCPYARWWQLMVCSACLIRRPTRRHGSSKGGGRYGRGSVHHSEAN